MRHGTKDQAGKADAYERELKQHRSYLFRFALIQLRDRGRAEDAVQETMLAAFEHRDSFHGNSSFKTWLTSILRNKIIDIIRKHAREKIVSELCDIPSTGETEFDVLFKENGGWQDMPNRWDEPDGALESKEFWHVFDVCNKAMPYAMAQVFLMREFLDLDTDEICKELAISPSNCHVLLYRARMRLRQCLGANWFGRG